MRRVSQLPDRWRAAARAQGLVLGSAYTAGLLRCAADLEAVVHADAERDELMLGVAVQKVGRATASGAVDRPGRTERAAEAVDLLYALWSVGLAHEVRPADWAGVVDLPRAVVDVLGARRVRTP